MAYCGNCGKEIPDGMKFCPNCGTAVLQYNQTKKPDETLKHLQSRVDSELQNADQGSWQSRTVPEPDTPFVWSTSLN